jgi:di/tripeptidase
MVQLGEMKPRKLWGYFEEICTIPRLSKNEEKIRAYLLDFARKHNLEAREDGVGNILIIREAFRGKEHVRTVVLQCHLDMVGEKCFTPAQLDGRSYYPASRRKVGLCQRHDTGC